ncbi:uncharacterized protein LOC111829415 [Capsella rubella]|uniref:uncharacterized protein LOC111829415 n=1 Tax=Capsella rubella TaxID=81985 RepID=UPI000CD4C960|nr:uncharacterized protein LOC111829415 [Capsella rubella]
MALDAASNGNYNTRSPAQATKLIENLASSNSTKVADFERKKLAQNMDGVQLAEVKAKLDSVHNLLVSKKTVKFAAEVEAVEPGADEEEGVNYVSGAGYLGQKFGNTHGNRHDNGYGQKGNISFVRTYGHSSYQSPPPPSADTEMKSMLEQILAGQQNMTVDFNGKMDALYTDLNGKIEALSTFTNKLDVKVAQTTGTVKKREGCNAILIRDGDDVWEEETSDDDETALAQQVSLDTISRCRSTPTSVLKNLVPDGPIPTEIDTKPKVPFPKPRKSKQEIEESRCKAMMEKVINEIHLDHADRDSPMLKQCVKRMVQNEVSPEEGALLARDMGAIFLKQTPQSKKEKKKKKVFVSEKVSAMIQSKIPEKLSDPGSFVLDCSIFTERFPHSLCDLGSGINLIPYSVAVRLGLTDFKPTRISLILADRSKRIPEGLLENVLIRIGECIIPTDFVVLKYSEEPQDPIILGISFLATAGALIDVQKGKIGLHVGDLVMNFDMDKLRRAPTIDGQTFSLEEAMDDVAVIEYSEDITARDQSEGLATAKLLEDDVFVLEMRIAETNCRKSAETQASGSVSSDTTMVSIDTPRHDSPNLPKMDGFRVDLTTAILSPVLNREASLPIPRLCPAAVPRVLGRSPTPNAYKPPWMMRHYSRRHLVPLSDQPDA